MQTYTLGLLLPASAALTDIPKELRWRLAISLEANVDLFDVRLFSDRDDFVCPLSEVPRPRAVDCTCARAWVGWRA